MARAGPRGGTGPEGPSEGFAAHPSGTAAIPHDNLAHTVASLTLPAGSYIVIGKAVIANSSSGYALDTCDLVPPGGTFNDGADIDESAASTDASTNVTSETVSTTGPLTTSGGTVTLQCVGLINDTTAYDRHLSAIKLATVTGT